MRYVEPTDLATAPAASATAAPCPGVAAGMVRPKLLYLVTEDWYFWSHRLPMARAARDAGFEVAVATRVEAHGERIAGENFRLVRLPWRRRGDGLFGGARALAAIAAAYRRERPDIVHHVALKPVLFGGLATRLAFPARRRRPAQVAAVAGLGSGLLPTTPLGRTLRPALAAAVRLAAGGDGPVIVQNPEDGAALAGFGVDPARIVLIRGSGVDTAHFAPMPEPAAGEPTGVALVSRMLHRKGVLDAVAAVRLLRARGVAIELLLAGPPDPDNRDSLDAAALAALGAEPGITWLGPVEDVRTVWCRAAVAVLPTTYGEGLPKALLEAAACGRAMVATDMPGCREVVRHGETGLLVPAHDVAALADALARLVGDPALRRSMGAAGRRLVEREFGEAVVAQQTVALYQTLLRRRPRR